MKVFRGGGLELHFIDETFSAERILIQGDTSRLSWAKGKVFGLPAGNCFLIEKDYSAPACFRAKFLYFSDLTATVTVDECDGAVRFSYLFRNEGKKEVSVEAGDLGVYFPFNDAFDTPSVTLRRRVHSFIRTDGSAYIYNARVSGESDAVSLIMTKGRCFSHRTQLRAFGVDKGDISLDLPALTLAPAESYEWEFLLFVHRDETDFFERARKYGFLTAEAERLVGYEGDVLTIRSDKAKVLSLGEQGEILFADGNVSYTLIGRGECALTIKDGENTRVLRCFTISRDIIDRRVDHLLQVRQISDGVGKGAFAAYDISTGTTVFPRRLDLVETTTMPLLFLLSEVARGRSAVRPAVDEALAFYDRETDILSAVKNGKASVEACSRYAAVKYESYLYRGDVVDLMESASVLSTLFGETYTCVPTCACRLIESFARKGRAPLRMS